MKTMTALILEETDFLHQHPTRLTCDAQDAMAQADLVLYGQAIVKHRDGHITTTLRVAREMALASDYRRDA